MALTLRNNWSPGPRFTIILKIKEYLNFKGETFTLEKTIFKWYSGSQCFRNTGETVHWVLMRKKYQIDFDFVSFYLNMKFSILKLRCSLSLRYGCDLGPGHHFIAILTRQRTFQSKFLTSARHYSIFVTVSDAEEHEL